MKVIPNLKYTDKHEWVKIDGEFAYIGITAYAQNQLGEVLFVEMPEVGDELNQGEEYGVVESSKVASDLIAPLSGEVIEINERLDDEPEYRQSIFDLEDTRFFYNYGKDKLNKLIEIGREYMNINNISEEDVEHMTWDLE